MNSASVGIGSSKTGLGNLSTLLILLYLYRCAFSFLGQIVILRITSIGDTTSYQRGHTDASLHNLGLSKILQMSANFNDYQASTLITAKIGGGFNFLFFGNAVMVNIGFQTIAFVGLAYLLASVARSQRVRLAILLAFPSFSVWSSIASKEAVVVFAVSILGGYIIRAYRGNASLGVLPVIAFAVLYVYKPQYLIAFSYLGAVTFGGTYVRQKAFLALVLGLASLVLLFVFRDRIDELSFIIQRNFLVVGSVRSTRLESFFVDQYDVFLRAPYGMYLAFVGPTLAEIATSPLHLITYVESIILVGILCYYGLSGFPKLPVYTVITGAFSIFWAVFPNYALGVMNSGSAIRYRTGWIVLVFIAVAILQSRQFYFEWRRPSGVR